MMENEPRYAEQKKRDLYLRQKTVDGKEKVKVVIEQPVTGGFYKTGIPFRGIP